VAAFFRWLIALPVAIFAVATLFLYLATRFGEQQAIGGSPGVEVDETPGSFVAELFEQWVTMCKCVHFLPPQTAPDTSWYGAKAEAPEAVETGVEPRVVMASSGYGSYYGNPSPDYPAACMEKGAEGEVVVAFDVTPSGAVRRARIVSSPDRCFDRGVLRTVSGWTYPPAYRNGRAFSRRGVTERFVFRLADYG
jgi:TonB family protein